MPSGLRVLSLRNVVSLLGVIALACLVYACGGDHNPVASNPLMPDIPAAATNGDAPVKAASVNSCIPYIGVEHVNFSVDPKTSDINGVIDHTFTVRFYHLPDSGKVHIAFWDRSQTPQKLLNAKVDTFKSTDSSFPLHLALPPGKWCDVQFDISWDDVPERAENYDGCKLIEAWYGAGPGCEHQPTPEPTPETTPQPRATPTPVCNTPVESFAGVKAFTTGTCSTPTPPPPTSTPRPTSTPEPTPTPRPTRTPEPTPTPTPVPTGTPQSTPTPNPTATPTPRPTATPTPQPTSTPTPAPTATPTPQCDITPSKADGLYCLDSPLGSEAAEAAWLGIDADTLVKKEQIDSINWTSDGNYSVVLLKDGKCGSDNKGTGYRVYSNVTVGQTLTYDGAKDISHGTIFGFVCN